MSEKPLRSLVLALEGSDGKRYEESLWVRPLADERLEVRNAPFILRGIAVGDQIFPRPSGGWNVVHGGNSSIVVFLKGVESRHDDLLKMLRDAGCGLERRGEAVAVDVPYSGKTAAFAALDDESAPWDWVVLKDAVLRA